MALDLSTGKELATGYRTHTCNELRMAHVGVEVSLVGWVQQSRDMKHFAFVDLRDRYGITQVVFDNPGAGGDATALANYEAARALGREYVVRCKGVVVERASKNAQRATGDVEVKASALEVLNASKTPPFLIQKDTDALEELRMQYRYLDIRREPIRDALLLRNKVTKLVRDELGARSFVEIETPILIKSTPEGARDFVVPSRANPGARAAAAAAKLPLRVVMWAPFVRARARRRVLRAAAVAADVQAGVHGRRDGPVLPDRQVLPRRGAAR